MKHLYLILLIFLLPKMQFAQGEANTPEQKEQKMYYFVFFGEGQSSLSPEEWTKLENFIWDVKLSNPKISRVDIHGYTSNSKTEKKFPTIAEDRANIVKSTINGFGIPQSITFTTKGAAVSKDEPADASFKRRATVCVYYTGTIKRDQGKNADPAFDPNFDKKITSTPATPAEKPKAEVKPKAEDKPVPPSPKKPAAKPSTTKSSGSNWE